MCWLGPQEAPGLGLAVLTRETALYFSQRCLLSGVARHPKVLDSQDHPVQPFCSSEIPNSVPYTLKSGRFYGHLIVDCPRYCPPEVPVTCSSHGRLSRCLCPPAWETGRTPGFLGLTDTGVGIAFLEEQGLPLTPKPLTPLLFCLFAYRYRSCQTYFCVKAWLLSPFVSCSGSPQRVNGKVKGKIFVGSSPVPAVFENTDLHSYVVMNHGRAYTAISTIPEAVGYSLLPLAPVGGIIGWMFAVEQDGFRNGFSITGTFITHQNP